MITILLVGPREAGAEAARQAGYVSGHPAAGHPSVEILRASGTEDALEKLARNRRIDAVLLMPDADAAELAAELAEEDPSAPPLFAPASLGAIPGVRLLPDGDPVQLLARLVGLLEPRA